MRHLRLVVAAAVAMALCVAPAGAAHGSHGHGGPEVSPAHKVAGKSGSKLLGEAWYQLLSNPVDTFSGGCIPLVRNGRVVAPEPDADFTAQCTIRKGTTLFFYFGSDCSDVEPPPFFGADAEAQRECAVAVDHDFFTGASISVDGAEAIDFFKPRFELVSPQRTVDLPPDNLFGVPAQRATFVAHAWAAAVRKLSAGSHTITVVVPDAEGGVSTFTASIEVVRGRR